MCSLSSEGQEQLNGRHSSASIFPLYIESRQHEKRDRSKVEISALIWNCYITLVYYYWWLGDPSPFTNFKDLMLICSSVNCEETETNALKLVIQPVSAGGVGEVGEEVAAVGTSCLFPHKRVDAA